MGESSAERWQYDAAAADRAVQFVGALSLREGGQFELMPYQAQFLRQLFGLRDSTGRRRYRRCSVWVPRGNGKTPLAAATAIYLMFGCGLRDADIYSVAADTEQARIAFADGAAMVRGSALLSSLTREYRRSLVYERARNTWRVMSSEPRTKHGYRPYCVIFDELHTQQSRALFAAMRTGLGKGDRDTLLVTISTAGVYDPESLAWQEYVYARQVLDGAIDAPEVLPMIYEAAPESDWTDPAVWRAANPGLGRTVAEDVIRAECEQAKAQPAALAEFLQFRLNIWPQARQAVIDVARWNACDQPILLAGPDAPCWIGIDVGETDDLAALAVWTPHEDGTHSVEAEVWLPSAKVNALSHTHRAPYAAWIDAKWAHASGEDYVDVGDIRRRIAEIRQTRNVRAVCFDPWNAYRLAQELSGQDGLTCVEIRQGSKTLSEPIKSFLELVAHRKLRHGGNPVLRWCAANFATRRDPNGNVAPLKLSKTAKIDAISAALNAWTRARLPGQVSVYDTRDMLVLGAQ